MQGKFNMKYLFKKTIMPCNDLITPPENKGTIFDY